MGTVEELAVQELVQNIVERGDGTVWIDAWRPQYVSLGATPKDFMEQRPDLFELHPRGRGFTVELVGEGEQMAKDLGAESGCFKGAKGGKGGKGDSAGPQRGPTGGVVLAEPIKGKGSMLGGGMMGPGMMGGGFKGGPKGGIVLAAPKGYGKGGDFGSDSYGKMGGDSFGPSKGGGKWGKGGAGFAALPNEAATGELADQAITEIKDQMSARGEPKVWIEDWRDRYRSLGPSPKQFLESRPDVFRLHYTGGKGYSVYLVEDEGGVEAAPPPYKGAPQWKGGGGKAAPQAQDSAIFGELDTPTNNEETEESCIDEITRLVKASPDGRICIMNWFKRFAHLAKSPRAFMEARPDKFVLTLTGSTYSVGLANPGSDAPGLAESKAQAMKRGPPLMISARPRPMKTQRLDPSAPISGAIGAAGHNSNPRNWGGPSPATRGPTPRGPAMAMAPADSALDFLGDKEEDALAEIFDQLSKPTCNGKINFPNWLQRFGHLASTPRAFIESHPDKFEVVPGPGMSFTVELC